MTEIGVPVPAVLPVLRGHPRFRMAPCSIHEDREPSVSDSGGIPEYAVANPLQVIIFWPLF